LNGCAADKDEAAVHACDDRPFRAAVMGWNRIRTWRATQGACAIKEVVHYVQSGNAWSRWFMLWRKSIPLTIPGIRNIRRSIIAVMNRSQRSLEHVSQVAPIPGKSIGKLL
jgi:hypothetical protein